MSNLQERSHLLKRMVIHSAKWPLIYLTLGIILIALSYIDNIFPITKWKSIFDVTDRLGDIFVVLAAISFIYHYFVLICLRYEQKMAHSQKIMALILANIRKVSRVIFVLAAIDIIITIASPKESYVYFVNSLTDIIIISSVSWVAIQIFYTVEVAVYEYMITLSKEEHIRVKALYTKLRIIRISLLFLSSLLPLLLF